MAVTISGTTGVGLVTSDALPFLAGQVCFFAQSTAPDGFLKCNGATVSRSTYDTLFAAIGTTYGAGDGSTTFGLPDLRGEFLRALDDGRGIDSSRSLGSAQSDDYGSHRHNAGISGYPASADIQTMIYGYDGTGNTGRFYVTNASTATLNPRTSTVGGTETRPRNIALLACIKY
jgi:microcystin-dependent protein